MPPHLPDLVVVFRTPSQSEAEVVRGLLETHGISAMIATDLSRTAFPLTLSELRIAVQAEDGAHARQIIDSHRDEAGPARVVPFGSELEPLERRIGYRFRDRGLLEHALTHSSRVHEDASGGVFDNESMEFLGDSVLGFVIADMLFREFPQHNEGQKSKLKASIVSAASLARLGEKIEIGDYLILGRGEEKTGGRRKHALIADCVRGVDRGDLPGRRGRGCARRSSSGSSPTSSTRRAAPVRTRRSRPTTSQRCRNGCSRTTAGCRLTAWRRKSGRRIGGCSTSKYWSMESRWHTPKARRRRKRRRRQRSWRSSA